MNEKIFFINNACVRMKKKNHFLKEIISYRFNKEFVYLFFFFCLKNGRFIL